MGQAFRRASGKIRTPAPAPPSSSSQLNKPLDRTQPAASVDKNLPVNGNRDPSSDGQPKIIVDDVSEERDPQYEAMLSKMAGSIRTRPGGKSEMGEAFVVDKFRRPLPKLRNTTPETSRYEEKPAPPGTINVAQLRHIMLLYQGKADDHNGPMDVNQIAEKFRIDVAQVQRAVQFLSMPPEYFKQKKKDPR